MFSLIKNYKKAGILGMNARNVSYIFKYNKRKNYPFADDKLKFKEVAQKAKLGVPELYGVIKSAGQSDLLREILLSHSEYVIKPSRGSGGEGVLVLKRTDDPNLFERSRGVVVNFDFIQHHVSNTLYGMYSLGGQPDCAMIEYRVQVDPIFEPISYRGVPDIRIIVLCGVPVMAMIRLPTMASNGRANLHQGAIGAGILMSDGVTRAGVQGSSVITNHPDTGNSIAGLKIPHWDLLLENASRCYDLTQLGYLGVDIVLDQFKGPMILEINARPGLAVQIANACGLANRLKAIEKKLSKVKTVEERIQLGKDVSLEYPSLS
jgi:alpha-L-glutamate ligase-like protein